jgi:hypothetical protein
MNPPSRSTCGWRALLAGLCCATGCWLPTAARADDEKKPAAPQAAAPEDDIVRKAEIMNSPRWRRAIFELGEWLAQQQIYTSAQVDRIKADFNRRVAGMSSFELEYLLDDLDAKFTVMDSPEARDARAWVGQYLSAMSDRKRAETLKDVPNVVTMSAGELQREITSIEEKRAGIREQQAAFDQGRQQMVQRAEDSRKETAAASAAAMAEARASFSPYRNQGSGQTPFANVRTGADMEFMGWGLGLGLCRF